eukprot:m.334786 g.334786  ORF g.334786 m.334786 type:complete len:565 (+) comp17438_c0_seq1:145-1839(+)
MAAVSQDAQAVNLAQTTKIPEWNQRLQQAVGGPGMKIEIDFNMLTQHVADPAAKHKVISAVVLPTSQTMGLTTTPPAAEVVVKSIEALALEEGTKGDMQNKIKSIQFFSLPPGSNPENKSLTIEGGIFKYTGAFSDGGKGAFGKAKVIEFLEINFFAQERALVSRFYQLPEGFPKHQERLMTVLPQGPTVNFDVVAAIGQASEPLKRLKVARTVISRDGAARTATYAAKKAEAGIAKVGSKIEEAALGKTDVNVPNDPEIDVYNSPNVMEPITAALEKVARASPENAQIIGSSIREIKIICQPGGTPAESKSLSLLSQKGTLIAPSSEAVPPAIQGATLLYAGCFESGSKGCFIKDDVLEFLEKHFRLQERGYVGNMMSEHVPTFNQRLQALISPQVEIEFDWNSIFPATLMPGSQRLDVAKTLCAHGSHACLGPLVKAIEEIVHAAGQPGPQNPVQTLLQQQVHRIVIKSVPTESAALKPSVSLAVVGSANHLVYMPALTKGARGVFDTQEAKDNLRSIFGIEKPASEKGAKAMLNKAGTELNRLGSDMEKALGKMSFMKRFK